MSMTKTQYYTDIALTVAKKATCLKKQYGAVIVKDDEVVSTGYNGNPRGEPHCYVCTKCDSGKDIATFSTCKSVHAEMNCIISASRKEMLGADIYLAGWEASTDPEYTKQEIRDPRPCEICLRLIKNAGINRIINRTGIIYERMDDGIMYCLKEPHD